MWIFEVWELKEVQISSTAFQGSTSLESGIVPVTRVENRFAKIIYEASFATERALTVAVTL